MSATVPCVPCCSSTVQTVNTPGSQGNSSVTTTTQSFVIPAINGTVLVHCGDTSWFSGDKNLFISDGANEGNFLVSAINSATSFTARFLGFGVDSTPGTTIQSAALVMLGIGNYTVPIDLENMDSITDLSGGIRANTIPATVAKKNIIIGPFTMSLLVNSQLWEMVIPFGFTLTSALFRCDVAITTGAKAATLSPRINAAATTGGAMAVAGTYATGATQAGTAITGNNLGSAGNTLEILVSGVTAFTEGVGHVELTILNTDEAACIAEFAHHIELLRSALRHQ